MTEIYRKTVFWWPAILRVILFSIMTSGGALTAQLHGKKTEDFAGYGWVEWLLFAAPVIGAFLGTIVAFLDQTMARLREENNASWKPGETI